MLKLDLQFFNDEEDNFDLEAFQQEFEAEWNESDETTEEVETTEEEVSEETEEEQTDEPSEDSEPEDEYVEPPTEEEKRNRAFADLRRQSEDNKKYAEFVNRLAEMNGVKPDDILKRFEENALEKQAQEQNVPVDVLKRINELEERNSQLDQQTKAQQFDSQVNDVVSKHDLKQEDVQKVFQYMADNGYARPNDLPTISFEDAYFLANRDTIIEKQVQSTRQKDLETKQKRQQSSALPSGNSVSQSDEITDDYVDEMLKKFDIRI